MATATRQKLQAFTVCDAIDMSFVWLLGFCVGASDSWDNGSEMYRKVLFDSDDNLLTDLIVLARGLCTGYHTRIVQLTWLSVHIIFSHPQSVFVFPLFSSAFPPPPNKPLCTPRVNTHHT